MQVWEKAAENLKTALLSYEDEEKLLRFHDQVPLWIVECLPVFTPKSNELVIAAMQKQTDDCDDRLEIAVPEQDLSLHNLSQSPPGMSPPMYHTSPPVPVMWHMSPENYQRGLSRLGGQQLVLALRYAAGDGAGTNVPSQGTWPQRHRNRSRAQAFIAALLRQLSYSKLASAQACSVVKSLATLHKLGLDCPEAGETLRALVSGPLSGWKVATNLTPSDISILLQGMASLVTRQGETSDDLQSAQVVAQASMKGSGPRLLELAACAVQEAGAPPATLRAMCGAAASLTFWCKQSGGEWPKAKRALERFLRAAAIAARDGPHPKPPQLKQPLAVLRAAGDCAIWSSDVFPMLAPMVTELILGRPVPKLPGYARDWKPLLPRPCYTGSTWRIEELAEVAWLYARGSDHRALEGQTGIALSLTFLVHLPTLAQSSSHSECATSIESNLSSTESSNLKTVCPSRSTHLHSLDSRLLAFACDSCRILRRSADAQYFESWRPTKQQTREHFDPQLLKDQVLSMQMLRKWKQHVALSFANATFGARRRRGFKERDEWLGRDVLAACSALAVFGQRKEVLPLTSLARSCLLRAYARQSPGPESRKLLRSWARCERGLKRKMRQGDEETKIHADMLKSEV